jgi:hypothetical protein
MADEKSPKAIAPGAEGMPRRALVHRILRYAPSPLRDEWVNVGVLLFDPQTGERRMRLIEEDQEYNRVRRLHPQADEALLRALRDDLESRFQAGVPGVSGIGAGTGATTGEDAARDARDESHGGARAWLAVLEKWDLTLSSALRLADPKATRAHDLDSELARLYEERVAVERGPGRAGLGGSRANLRTRCSQIFHQAKLWDRLDESVRAEQFTFPGDPMLLDYSYRRNGTRGFVQTLSVTRAPADAKLLAYTAKHILDKGQFSPEFTAVTDVALQAGNDRHRFVRDTLGEFGIEPVPLEGFAVWVAKLRPMLQ